MEETMRPVDDASSQTNGLCVRDVMTEQVLTVSVDDDVRLATQIMLWGRHHHLPVVDGDELVGIVTDRDLYRAQAEGRARPSSRVSAVMTAAVHTTSPDEALSRAAARMAGAHIGSMPVVDQDRLVGIVTSTDLLASLGRSRHTAPTAGTVRDVMNRQPYHIGAGATVAEAVTSMVGNRVRHLPVVDREGRLIGMLGDRDLRAFIGDPVAALRDGELAPTSTAIVEEVMTPNPAVLRPGDNLDVLAWCFLDERVGAVPVIDDGDYLVGIVSYVDVLSYTFRALV
jgi:CBS domain-containing protein